MVDKSERPAITPDGFEFPYSHFGDPEKRTRILSDIGQRLDLNPQLVFNVGSGYDITPSDAFPNARVIHIDIVPMVVGFLRSTGFEAYEPKDVPGRLVPDLIIDILGPGSEGIPQSSQTVIITTSRTIHQGDDIMALVDDGDSPNVITDYDEMSALWQRGNGEHVHLLVKRFNLDWDYGGTG